MLNFITIKNISAFSFFISFFIFSGLLFADNKGQIININQSYQIAFTDLGNNILKQGDIVKVSLNADEFVYMQVLESSAILSKLGPSQSDSFRTNLKDFQNMAVGNEVVKVNQSQENTDHPIENAAESKEAMELSDQKMLKLEEDLAQAKEEIKSLEASNEESKAKLNELSLEAQAKLAGPVVPQQSDKKDILGQLKVHLDSMHKLLDENN